MATEMIVAIFPSRALLTKALDHLNETKPLEIEHAAIVAKANTGELVVIDDDIGADEGGIAGGTLGAAMAALGMVQFGALAIPGVGAFIALGAGALVGALVGQLTGRAAANLIDYSKQGHDLRILTHYLETGRPALVLEVENGREALPLLQKELKAFRAETVERLRAMAASAGR